MKIKSVFLLLATTAFLCGCVSKMPENNVDYNLENQPQTDSSESAGDPIYLYADPFDASTYEYYFQNALSVMDIGSVKGTILPHHLIGGYIPATFFNYLKNQKPELLVFIGPNHSRLGNADVISAQRDWQTPFGRLRNDNAIIKKLNQAGIVKIDDQVMSQEYSISSLVGFAAKTLPDTLTVSFIFPYDAATSSLDNFFSALKDLLPEKSVIVASVDFSHYQNTMTADFHDQMNRSVIRNLDLGRIADMEIDSPPSVYLLMKFMKAWNSEKIAYEISDNSAAVTKLADLDEITSYYSPFFVKGNAATERTASILMFGDLMLDRNVKKQIDKFGTDYLLGGLAGKESRFFMGTDAIAANLEGPFANYRRETTKEIAFCFDPSLLPMLKKYNFNIFSQANNHSLDMGQAGFAESEDNLKKYGFDVFGSQYRVDERSVLIKKIGDYDIAFIGLNDTNSPVDIEAVRSLLAKSDSLSDIMIVNIHWGNEYAEESNERQRWLARELIDSGADAVIGHHPHVIQEMEIYKNRPILYSLGNFIFDQYFSIPTQQSLAAGLFFGEKAVRLYIFPLEQSKSRVMQMPDGQRTAYLSEWFLKSRLDSNIYNGGFIEIPR